MARVVPIRIRANDKSEYQRLAANAKRKISRVQKKYGVDLTAEVTIPKLGGFKTRKEYNEWKESVQSFTNRGNLDYQFVQNDFGVTTTKKKLQKVKQNTKRAQRDARKLVKQQLNKPVYYKGKQIATQGQQVQMMRSDDVGGITVPPDFDFDKMRTVRQFEDKMEAMEKRASPEYFDKRMLRMQLNFEDMLSVAFNTDSDELIQMIDQLSPKEFWEMYNANEEFNFRVFYEDGTTQDEAGAVTQMTGITSKFFEENKTLPDKEKLEKMLDHIRNFNDGTIDRSLENF